VPVCVPIPGLGVTDPVPVLCAVASPTDNANTDDANKILRIKAAPCGLRWPDVPVANRITLQNLRLLDGMPVPAQGDVAAELPDATICPESGCKHSDIFARRPPAVGQMPWLLLFFRVYLAIK
jgi:hypothetical protein